MPQKYKAATTPDGVIENIFAIQTRKFVFPVSFSCYSLFLIFRCRDQYALCDAMTELPWRNHFDVASEA